MISKKRRNFLFLEAGILTVIIYLTALILTGFLDEFRINYLKVEILEFENSQFFLDSENYFFYKFENDVDCLYLKENIFFRNLKLRELGEDLGNFGSLFLESNLDRHDLNKRKFYLNELNLYFQTLNYNNNCNEKIVPVFYFFEENSNFDSQGAILEQFALNQKNKTIVFSFDISFDEDFFLEELKEQYKVNSAPYVRVGDKILINGGVGEVDLNTISVEFLRQRGDLE